MKNRPNYPSDRGYEVVLANRYLLFSHYRHELAAHGDEELKGESGHYFLKIKRFLFTPNAEFEGVRHFKGCWLGTTNGRMVHSHVYESYHI